MVNQELLTYIRGEIAKGSSIDSVKTNLHLGGGWSDADITEAFQAVNVANSNVIQTSPVPTTSPMSSIPQPLSITPSKSKTGIWVAAGILVLAVLGGGAFFIMNKKTISQPVVQAVQIQSPVETLKVLDVPTKVSGDQYDEYFKNSVDATQLDGFTQSGNVGVKLDNGDVIVAFPPTPNMNIDDNTLLEFTSVKDSKGNEIFDPTSSFESESFWTHIQNIDSSTDPIPYVTGERAPSLIKDAPSDDIVSVTGNIVFILPVDMNVLTLTSTDIGKPNATPTGGTVTLKSFGTTPSKDDPAQQTSTIVVSYDGFGERVAYLKAVDNKGNVVQGCGYDFILPESGYEKKDYTITCDNAVSVVFADSASTIKKDIPFSINASTNSTTTTPTATPSPSSTPFSTTQPTTSTTTTSDNVSATDKAAIIEAEVKFFGILQSGDASKIRAYMTTVLGSSTDPADKAQLDQLKQSSDKDLLSTAAMIISFTFPGAKDANGVRVMLNASNAVWTETTQNGQTSVNISIKSKSSASGSAVNSTMSFTSKKINGVWY